METYAEPGGSEIDTAAILTTAASGDIADIHDRMPVVISPEDFERWLDCRTSEPRDVARSDADAGRGAVRGDPGVRQRQQGCEYRARTCRSGSRSAADAKRPKSKSRRCRAAHAVLAIFRMSTRRAAPACQAALPADFAAACFSSARRSAPRRSRRGRWRGSDWRAPGPALAVVRSASLFFGDISLFPKVMVVICEGCTWWPNGTKT